MPDPASTTRKSAEWFDRARAVTPGGVNSPVRAFNAVGGTPRWIASAEGAWLTDVDGNRYVDLVCSWGPMLLGHAHPEVTAAVTAAVARGTSYGTPTCPEVELAEEIVARTPVDQVRLVSSGTEATMSAIRLARGFTGRDVIIKFAGCYHGHVDSLLAAAGSGLVTLRQTHPGTPGVPESATALTLVLGYNDTAAVAEAFAEYGDRIACVITEAAPGNMGVVPPSPGFNAFLSEICARHGALFISDEVMTGFRVSRTGQWGLDGAVEGWIPDLMTFGKVMGGGFPAAAFGGRADVMAMLSPVGPVYQAGTLSGNPVATTAGLATLRLATEQVYADLSRTAETIRAGVTQALGAAGVPHLVQSTGTMFSVFFGEKVLVGRVPGEPASVGRVPGEAGCIETTSPGSPGLDTPRSARHSTSEGDAHSTSEGGARSTSEGGARSTSEGGARSTGEGGPVVADFEDAKRTDETAYKAFFHAMLDAGVYLPPSAYEAWFVSAAHDDRAVGAILDALPGAARAAAEASEGAR